MRKLASVQKIREIHSIPDSNNLEKAMINSWPVVIKKGEYKVGEFVVYCEPDSFLPIRPEYEFLRSSSYKKMGDKEGFRIRTIKLRKTLSQGLILPLSSLNIVSINDEKYISCVSNDGSNQSALGDMSDDNLQNNESN